MLVQSGWVGSYGAGTEHLAGLVAQALDAGRAVQLAVAEGEATTYPESPNFSLRRTPSARSRGWRR